MDLKNYLDFCTKLSFEHSSGKSITLIASEQDIDYTRASCMTAVGYLPERLKEKILSPGASPKWMNFSYLETVTRLRMTKNFRPVPTQYHQSYHDLNYNAVEELIDLVNSGSITSRDDLRRHIAQKKIELGLMVDQKPKKKARNQLKDEVLREIKAEYAPRIEQMILSARKKVTDAHLLRGTLLWQQIKLLSDDNLETLLIDIEQEIVQLSQMSVTIRNFFETNSTDTITLEGNHE